MVLNCKYLISTAIGVMLILAAGCAKKPAPGPIDESIYVGCFLDRGEAAGTRGRDLNKYFYNAENMTIGSCLQDCRALGYPYAGLQSQAQCFCGYDYGRFGSSDNCTNRCGGDQLQICGGTWANSIYRVPGYDEEPPGEVAAEYVGCYVDSGDPKSERGHDLDGYMLVSGKMTTELCAKRCSKLEYQYAATQGADKCFCGNSYGKYGESEKCRTPCAGNASEVCGGIWINKVYMLGITVE